MAGAIVTAARARSIPLIGSENVREAMGSGIEGRVAGKLVKAGSDRFVFGHGRLPPWAVRVLRRASWRSALIGAALDIDAVLADRVPSDKVEAVAVERRLHPTIMVGDGINDAPALAAADVKSALQRKQ